MMVDQDRPQFLKLWSSTVPAKLGRNKFEIYFHYLSLPQSAEQFSHLFK